MAAVGAACTKNNASPKNGASPSITHAAVTAEPALPSAPPSTSPRLVVMVVVDQLRGDEIARYDALWRYGLRRLRDEGRWYSSAWYSHGRTETAAGHATIATGLHPRYHGIIDKDIYSPKHGKALYVCDFGEGPCEPKLLLEPTLGDRLKAMSPQSKVVALAQKDRAAMLMGGRKADLVAWFDPKAPRLVGRTAGEAGLPQWLQLFFEQVGSDERISRIWELPRLPQPFAARNDAADEEWDCGHGITFPHRLPAPPALRPTWLVTPDSDRALTEVALRVARQLELGQDAIPDLLMVSFGATDRVGHAFGTESLERVAVLMELDRFLGELLDGLQAMVSSQVMVTLTSDHGVGPTVAWARANGFDAGRVDIDALAQRVEQAVSTELAHAQPASATAQPPRRSVAAIAFPFVHLTPIADPALHARAVRAAVSALKAHPHVYDAWPSAALADATDEVAHRMFESCHPQRCGDVVFTLMPHYERHSPLYNDKGASHGSPWDYDRHVPVIMWGDGVTGGRDDTPVKVIDLSRTVADRIGLPVDERGGRPLPMP